MNRSRCVFFSALIFLTTALKSGSLFAFDFGLLINQYAGFGNHGAVENDFNYQAGVLPRFSFLIGDAGDFIASAALTLEVDDGVTFIPELMRTELSLRFGDLGVRAGRISYSDPLSFVANGLFDGVHFSYNSAAGNFSAGVWYTGLLYKKTANIIMTEGDWERYNSVLDYGDFPNTYFAPSRLLFSFDWRHPSIAELISLRAAVTGQVDLAESGDKFHSQYLTLTASAPFKSFLFELGAGFMTAQTVTADETDFNIAFAWTFGVFWTLPTSFNSRLSLTGNFAGGGSDGVMKPFVPVTTKTFGDILEVKLSGIMAMELNYTARLTESLAASAQASCFIRNDLATYKGYPVNGADSESYFLGTEIFARLIWSVFSDLQLNFGGGAFFPSNGDEFSEKPIWRVELTAIFTLM